jgi:pseudouridine-5'-phosphate glycosidase
MNPLILSSDVARALRGAAPLVALESTVITHGLPHPHNLNLARDMESAVRAEGAVPATVAVLDGQVRVGLTGAELERLARDRGLKISRRDLGAAVHQKASGGTTVAATLFAARQAGLRVFATGGIGGVHRGAPFDISADLPALAQTPLIVVCAGAKAILDLPATLEYLETMSVPVAGYQTDEFPAFSSRESGLSVSVRLDSPEAVAGFASAHWNAGMNSAVLVANPIPAAEAIPRAEMEPIIEQAAAEAARQNIHGQALTPFLLQRISDLTQERSLRANLALLLSNARLAARVAGVMAGSARTRAV